MLTEPEPAGGRFGASLDVTIDLPLASAGSRGLARGIDTVVYLLVNVAVGSLLGVLLGGLYLSGVVSGIEGAGVLIGLFLVLLFVFQWSLATSVELWMRGQTPGKKLLGLRTVRDDGGSLTLVPALLRNLLRVDSFPVISLVDLAVMYLHPSSKRLGDLAAGTVVVDEGWPAERRTWSPALSAADVALLQIWFARAPDLDPARRALLAGRLITRLASGNPGLQQADVLDASLFDESGNLSSHVEPVSALERLAPRVVPPADPRVEAPDVPTNAAG